MNKYLISVLNNGILYCEDPNDVILKDVDNVSNHDGNEVLIFVIRYNTKQTNILYKSPLLHI